MKKTVFITGGSGGIGRACALSFAAAGWNVAFCYKENESGANETVLEAEKLGARCVAVRADVSKSAEVNAAVEKIIGEFGEIEALVCNAGISRQRLFTDITDADFDEMISTNLGGVFYACRAVLPQMIRRKSGRIINIASIWGEVGASCEVDYSAAKAGVIGMTKALAKEVGPSGITVNAVSPGVIETRMNNCHSEETMKELCEATALCRIGSAKEVAETALFLASEGGAFITGQVIPVNGGFMG